MPVSSRINFAVQTEQEKHSLERTELWHRRLKGELKEPEWRRLDRECLVAIYAIQALQATYHRATQAQLADGEE